MLTLELPLRLRIADIQDDPPDLKLTADVERR
jgi:hypothetical protein